MYTIEDFQALLIPEKIVITQHSHKRFIERGICLQDVIIAVKSGIIIEQYPEDFPFPSCLILGESNSKFLHIVASINEGLIYIITAYIPDPSKWNNEFSVRKE